MYVIPKKKLYIKTKKKKKKEMYVRPNRKKK